MSMSISLCTCSTAKEVRRSCSIVVLKYVLRRRRTENDLFFVAVTKMPVDTCIRTRKIIKCSVLNDSYLHHVYFHARDYFTKRQSTLPFRGIYVMGMEAFICIYGKLLFPKEYVYPFFGEPENNLLSLEQ